MLSSQAPDCSAETLHRMTCLRAWHGGVAYPGQGISCQLEALLIRQVHEQPVGEDHIAAGSRNVQLCGIANNITYILPVVGHRKVLQKPLQRAIMNYMEQNGFVSRLESARTSEQQERTRAWGDNSSSILVTCRRARKS